MDKHVHFIAILWIIYGILGILFGFFVFLLLFGISFIPNTGDIAPGILRIAAWIASLFFMALALPQLIGGIALLKREEWGRILILVVSFFHLINFPLGTALAVYSLVILLREDTVRLFGPSGLRKP
jgi:hypothetical protein